MLQSRPPTRRRSKWLRDIPSADAVREKLKDLEVEVLELRELLSIVERIESVVPQEANRA